MSENVSKNGIGGSGIINNRDRVPLEHYMAVYAKADPAALAARTGAGWDSENGFFTVVFMDRLYRVTWPGFEITAADEKADDNAGSDAGCPPLLKKGPVRLLLLRFLLEGMALESTGRFLTYREVPWGEVYVRQFTGRCIIRFARTWGGRIEEYRSRMERLGGRAIPDSDAGYSVFLFPGFEIRFLLWAGDEDFPSSAQILFSDNFAAAFHAEDLVVAAETVIGAL